MDQLGTRLAEIIKQDIGIRLLRIKTTGCPTCEEWVEQINRWGIKGTKKYRRQIETHLFDQAQEKTLFVATLARSVVEKRIAGWVDRAIEEQELAERRLSR